MLPALLATLDDENDFVKSFTGVAIGNLKDPAAVEPLLVRVRETPDSTPRSAYIAALGKIGDPRAAESIRPLLNDVQPVVRESAKKALEAFEAGGAR